LGGSICKPPFSGPGGVHCLGVPCCWLSAIFLSRHSYPAFPFVFLILYKLVHQWYVPSGPTKKLSKVILLLLNTVHKYLNVGMRKTCVGCLFHSVKLITRCHVYACACTRIHAKVVVTHGGNTFMCAMYTLLCFACARMVDYMHVHESMRRF
jgi:hypothetical protein